MLCHQDPPVHLQPLPVIETGSFTLEDLQDLLSFLDPAEPCPNSGSEGSNWPKVDERKRKRMVSNRESARRSRWRKKRHLEELNEQMSRFTVENRELENQLAQVVSQCHFVRRENERLRSECIALAARLSDLYRIVKLQQLS